MRRRINRLCGGERIVFWDSFTDAANTQIHQHAPDGGGRWVSPTAQLSSVVQAEIDSTGQRLSELSLAQATTVALKKRGRRDGSVSCDLIKVGTVADSIQCGLVFRLSVPGRYYLWARANHTGGNWQLIRRTHDQSEVIQGSANQALTQDQAYRLRLDVRKAVGMLWVDDVLLIKADMCDLPKKSGAGVRLSNNVASSPQQRLDNWMTTR